MPIRILASTIILLNFHVVPLLTYGHDSTLAGKGTPLTIDPHFEVLAVSGWLLTSGGEEVVFSIAITSDAHKKGLLEILHTSDVQASGRKKTPSGGMTSKFGRRVVTLVNKLGMPFALTVEGSFAYDPFTNVFEPINLDSEFSLLDRIDHYLEKEGLLKPD